MKCIVTYATGMYT